ncbi:hypothetical protein [Paraburkholderia sp. SG-MS1]|uniref:hypothetical protein n=1 Tax=Paraburkholderia sp. SG-MS1 TaxID=2023741 RepID=UPI0014459F76|nr:hypothetical protein [Paraburkholderia sp. SG-MS1]
MVYVFFCMSGALGPLRPYCIVPKSHGEKANMRSLEGDVLRLEASLSDFPGAVIVAGNAWPLYYDLESIRQAFARLGSRVVNVVSTLADRKEEAVLDYMSNRSEPYVVLASPEFEFSSRTDERRIDVDGQRGFDQDAQSALRARLRSIGDPAARPLTKDDILQATASALALRRASRILSRVRASEDSQFQRSLRALLGER